MSGWTFVRMIVLFPLELGLSFVLSICTTCLGGWLVGVWVVSGWVGAGGSRIKTKLSPQQSWKNISILVSWILRNISRLRNIEEKYPHICDYSN